MSTNIFGFKFVKVKKMPPGILGVLIGTPIHKADGSLNMVIIKDNGQKLNQGKDKAKQS